MDFDLSKCVWVRTDHQTGRQRWERQVISHGIRTLLFAEENVIKILAPCKIFIDPFTKHLVFTSHDLKKVKGYIKYKEDVACIEVTDVDLNGPLVVISRFFMLCLRTEEEEMKRKSARRAAKARKSYLANLANLVALQPNGEQLDSSDILDHIGPPFQENLVPNPGDKAEMYSFKDDVPIPTN